ncbi:MAG: MFS transporter [Rhodospirillales bacterium]|nr:MFS transporter [Rhodospirillales bacterium]
MAPQAISPRVRRIQRTAMVLLVLSGVVNYIDRATLAVGNPLIREELGLSVSDRGLLLSAFLWAYAFSQLPAGALVDRFGPRRMLPLALGLWSLAQLAGGLVTSFGQFFGARMLLGVGEAPQFPSSARVVRDWFHIGGRGTAISAPLLTVLMLNFGWRWMFVIMGVAGLLVAAAFYLLHRDPRHVPLDAAERAYLTEGDEAEGQSQVTWREWKRLFAFRTTWGMIIGFFGTIYVTWVYNAWLPGYLEMQRHISISKTGWIAAIPYIFGVIGSLLGGRLADWLVTRGVSPMNSRKYPMTASLLLTAGFTAWAALTPSDWLSVACISVSLFLLYVSSATAWAMAPVAAPAHCTASIGAMQNFGGYFGGALAPMLTGFIVQATGSFVPAQLLAAGVALCAAVGYFLVVRDPVPAMEDVPGASYARG